MTKETRRRCAGVPHSGEEIMTWANLPKSPNDDGPLYAHDFPEKVLVARAAWHLNDVALLDDEEFRAFCKSSRADGATALETAQDWINRPRTSD
jgi:hypothetical protein